jgi:hypothetical protein
MKGMMVTLLMLGLTGTVNARQFQNNDLPFRDLNPARPAPEQDAFPVSGKEQMGDQLPPQFLQLALPFDPEVIQHLRKNGVETASIDRPRETGEVIFGFAKPLADAKNSPNYQNIKPVAAENGALIFELTESDLEAVETSTLRYRFAPSEIGRYSSIVVRLGQPQNAPFAPAANSQSAGSLGTADIQPPAGGRELVSPPGGAPRLQNDPFRRTAGTNLDQSIPSVVPDRFALNDKSPSAPGMSGLASAREPQTDSWKTDSRRGMSSFAPPLEAAQRPGEYSTRTLDARDSELRMREQQLAEKERAFLAEQQRIQRSNAASTGANWNSTSNSTSQLGADNRLASSAVGSRPQNEFSSIGTSPSLDTNLQNLTAAVHDGFTSLNQTNLELNRRIQAIESQRASDIPVANLTQNGSVIPDRLARTPPTMIDYQAQIKGLPATNQNMSGPLYFMLICSIGLNVYLGLISRNFYVRYNELADELRETFSASISS